MFPRHLRGRGVETSSPPQEPAEFRSPPAEEKARTEPRGEPRTSFRLPSRRFNAIHPLPPRDLTSRGFVSSPGRVSRGFDAQAYQRVIQAEEILKSFRRWPPQEGDLFVIQIDQDSPPPPPLVPVYDGKIPLEKFQRLLQERKKAVEELQTFVTQYTGRTIAFRYEKRRGQLQLVELNRAGSFRSASHVSQVGGVGSCNDDICGIAWLRPGIYPYLANTIGVFNPLRDDLTRVARDLNNDGAVDRRESWRSNHAHGFAIQIHPGFPGSPRSEGCQTFPPEDFGELQKIIQDSKVEKFYYVLARRPNEKWGMQSW